MILIFGDPVSIRVRDIGREAALRRVVYCPSEGCYTSGTDQGANGMIELKSFGVRAIWWHCNACFWVFQTDYDGRHVRWDDPR